jgi:hypothetical protein
MNILITYDIEEKAGSGSAKNTAVKNAMKKNGYFDEFTASDPTTNVKTDYYLPNTSLWKKDITSAIAKADLLKAAKDNGAVVERLFATQFINWDAIPGKKYVEK